MSVSDDLTPDEFVETLDDRMLQCRELGHTWRIKTTWHRERGLLGFRRILQCSSCKSRRIDIVGASGTRIGTKYEHAEGYLYTGGRGRVSRDTARHAALVRSGVLEEES